MARRPEIDLGPCSGCEACVEICPEVFRFHQELGFIEVVERDAYPEEEVDRAISMCPQGCICWGDE